MYELCFRQDIIHATSNLLDEETENTWLVTEAKGKPGATEVARDFEGFYLDLLDKVSMNGRTNLDYTKTSENIGKTFSNAAQYRYRQK